MNEMEKEGRRERERSTAPVVYARGNYARPDGNADARARPGIHIQIELYALPDALIRNHSTAWYLENKPVSPPPLSPRPRV